MIKINLDKKLKEFHLTCLPEERLYLILDGLFLNKFFKRLYQIIGKSTILSKKLNVVDETIRRWKLGKRAIPNWALLRLNNLLKNKKFSIQEIEKNVIAYKGESSNKLITKPKLPIVEDERLIRIVSHLLCDGYDGGKKHLPVYNNTEKALINKFINDLSIFGNVPIRLRKYSQNKQGKKLLYRVEFPRIFTHILRKIYDIQDFNGNKSKFPNRFFKLPKKLSFSIIQTFFDDEGYVGESSIRIGLSNFELLNSFRNFIIYHFPNHKKDIKDIKEYYNKGSYSKNMQYKFEIKRSFLDKYHKNIEFCHPRKRELLNSMIERSSKCGNKYPEGVAKEIILNLLSKRPSSAIDLALRLKIKPKNIRFHLERFKKEDKIELSYIGYQGAQIWKIKNEL